MKNYVAVTGMLASSLVGMQAYGIEREGAAKDAWIDGQLEAVYALNRHLSAFAIDTEVDKGIVHLTGNVNTTSTAILRASSRRVSTASWKWTTDYSSCRARVRLPRKARIDRSVRGSTMPRRRRA